MLWEHLSPVDGYAQQYAQTTVPFRHLFNLESRRDSQNGVCLACDPYRVTCSRTGLKWGRSVGGSLGTSPLEALPMRDGRVMSPLVPAGVS